MLRIDSATQSLVCIQIPNNARCAVADLLRGNCIEIPSDSGYVRFEEADDFPEALSVFVFLVDSVVVQERLVFD